ncbi:hypothetical protein GINT2_000979 [Glugoides intestinalis]
MTATATETTTKPFEQLYRELTFKEVLSMSFSGSLFNTAMFIVASIFIFLAIIWLYYRNYYFKALGIMKTVGLLVSSGILFGSSLKVLLTIAQLLAGSYGCVFFNYANFFLTLYVPVFILVISLYLLFNKWLHENIGLLPEAAATDGTVESDKEQTAVPADSASLLTAANN